MLVLLALCFSFGPQFVGGVRLPGCSSNRLQVDETTNTVITCDQIGAQDAVEWFVSITSTNGGTTDLNGGVCDSNGLCFLGLFPLSRTSTESTLTIASTLGFIRNLTKVKCGKQGDTSVRAECRLDVVYRAEMPATSCKVEAKSGTWTVDGSCPITKTYSSMAYYKCQVFTGTNASNQPNHIKDGSYSTSSHSNNKYRTGSCTFSEPISNLLTPTITTQNFYFKFSVYPGPTHVTKGPVTIERPASPTMKCPDIIRENTAFTCTCSTTNIGQPPGNLYWSRGGQIQTEGDVGTTSLTTATQTLTRGENGQTQFSCGIRWAVDVGADVYTANVGFPPSRAALTLNQTPSTTPVTVNEDSDVSFTCQVEEGNPVSTLTLSGRQSTPLKTGPSPLVHSVGSAKCEHSGLYTCKAGNGYGEVTAEGTLYVNCIPRGDEDVDAVNFINNSVSASFEVTAYPTPHSVTFKFLGQNGTDDPTAVQSGSIELSGSCTQTGLVYRSTCLVTVANVTTANAAGFYQVSVTNGVGTGTFKLQVKYKAPIVSDQKGDDEGVPVAAIVGAVVGAILIIVLVAVILTLIFLKRRRKAAAQSANGSETPGTSDPQHAGGALTSAPADEYAVIHKPKKPAGAAAADATTAANGNDDKPGDVYAMVDKKAKKNADPAGGSVQNGAKPKAPAHKDKKKKKPKAPEKDEAAHVYGNVGDTQPDKKNKKAPHPPKEDTSSGRPHVTHDGLMYSSVMFSKESPHTRSRSPPKPAEDAVVYSEVTFTKPAAASQ